MRKLQQLKLCKLVSSYKEPHHVAVRILVQGLLDLGIMQGNLEEIIASESYRQFYMHGTGIGWVWMCMMSVAINTVKTGVYMKKVWW